MTNAPLFSVVIPVFNNWELTRNCLQSLKECTADLDCEVIVADNGSSDETAAHLAPLGEALFGPRFTRLRFEENRNFGPASNAGARAASAPLLFFLNNDTLLTPGWAPPLLEAFAADAALGAAGPLLLYENDTIQHLGVAVGLGTVGHLYQGFPKSHRVAAKARTCQALTAAALMLPRTLFLDMEGFYEGFINGVEDVDLCLRLGRAGKRLRCYPASVVYHLESRTPGRKLHEDRNGLLLHQRQGENFVPDKHRHGCRDGFAPFINDFLDIGLKLTDEEEARLLRESGKNLSAIYETCLANPYWLAGRELLYAMFRKQGRMDMALAFLAQISDIHDTVQSFEELHRLCLETGRESTAVEVRADMERLRSRCGNADQIQRLIRRYTGRGDRLLDDLFRQRFGPSLP